MSCRPNYDPCLDSKLNQIGSYAAAARSSAQNSAASAEQSEDFSQASAFSAGQSATSATNSANSATASANSASEANNYLTQVTNIFEDFDERYLGAKSVAPTVDNQGNPLQEGALYWNSVSDTMFAWNGTIWVATNFNQLTPFLATGTTIARNLVTRSADVVNVKDFGAVGNGGADDTIAIQNAINTTKMVYIPNGTYKVTSTITLSSSASGIFGESLNAVLERNFVGGALLATNGRKILKDFSIKTKSTFVASLTSADTGIDCISISLNALFSNIQIIQQWHGFKWQQGQYFHAEKIWAESCKGNGFYGINPRGLFTECFAQTCEGDGYNFEQTAGGETGVQLNLCATFANKNYGYKISGTVQGANVFMSDCNSSFDNRGGVNCESTFIQLYFRNLWVEYSGYATNFFPSWPSYPTATGVFLSNVSESTFSGTTSILNCKGSGMVVGNNCNSIAIDNLYIQNIGNGLQGSIWQNGLSIGSNVQNLVVSSFTNGNQVSPNQTYDIAINNSNCSGVFNTVKALNIYSVPQTGIAFVTQPVQITIPTIATSLIPTLPEWSNLINISGTSAIFEFTIARKGRIVTLKMLNDGINLFTGNNLRLAGNFVGTTNDTITLASDGTLWYEVARSINQTIP